MIEPIKRVYSFCIHLDTGSDLVVEAPTMSEAVRYVERRWPTFKGIPKIVRRVYQHTFDQSLIHSTVGFAQRPKYPDGQTAIDPARVGDVPE